MDHNHQELDIFRTYLDINEIPHDESRLQLAHRILHQHHSQIITFHPRGFVFYYFDQFIQHEISLEQFMTMGDVENSCEDQINPYIYKQEHPCFLDTLTLQDTKKRKDSDLVIVDATLRAYYLSQHTKTVVKDNIVLL